MAGPRPGAFRCAIYTRKSTDEGLDQEFNSLHAQREACEAYIRSQAGEGWSCLPALYDDGGFSGGDMQRPALRRLLDDIAGGRIHVVVVYKVDRLTRSLADFAKIVEAFDGAGVSFVSVTQAFNTTTSMGRLTLNVLLSFAQFEREVTGERIRDKVAASKAKGMWMGGMIPLGYDLKDRQLVINPAEAELVRRLFRRYLELKSVHLLRDELNREGVRTKSWVSRGGRAMGGASFARGGLFHLLRNRIYLAEIVHREAVHVGRHQPIVDRELFDAVQAQFAANARKFKHRRTRASEALLTGKIFDANGDPMRPSFAYGRRGGRYRYYVSAALQCGGRADQVDGEFIRRVPAAAMEGLVRSELSAVTGSEEPAWADTQRIVSRIEVHDQQLICILRSGPLRQLGERTSQTVERIQTRLHPDRVLDREGRDGLKLTIPMRAVFRGGRVRLELPRGARGAPDHKVGAELARALKSVHRRLDRLAASPLTPPEKLREIRAITDSSLRRLLPIAFLAPDLQTAIARGELIGCFEESELLDCAQPLAWADQRALLIKPGDFADLARKSP